MSWEDQGRQDHGWFGHGTAEGAGLDFGAVAKQIAYSAVGSLPAVQRGSYEGWMGRGGVDQVAAVLPGWVAGSDLPEGRFHAVVFGSEGSHAVADHAQAVGLAVAAVPAEGAIAAAGRHFAALVRAARPEALGRVMAQAVARAGTPALQDLVRQVAARPGPAARPAAAGRAVPARRPGTHGAHSAHLPARPLTPEEQHKQNVDDLAKVIQNEARGHRRDAMVAVGWTLRNRMLRNGVAMVDQAWRGYNHGAMQVREPDDRAAYAVAREVAEGILSGRIADPTDGATHYYSPSSMPQEGERPHGDVSGGLESVPGVVGHNTGKPIQNYRPGYTVIFPQKIIPGIPESNYKFFRQPDGASRVR